MSRFESWSRRKRGLEESDADIMGNTTPEPTIDTDSQPTTETEPMLEEGSLDARLPDPDTLEPGNDFSSFLRPGISAELKRRALRRMFTAEHYHVRDGLDDYDQDFSKMRKLNSEATAQLRRWMDKLTESESDIASEQTQPAYEDQEQYGEDLAHEEPSDAQPAQRMGSTRPT